MTTRDASSSQPQNPAEPSVELPVHRTWLDSIARLWRAPNVPPPGSKDRINRLDQREIIIGSALCVLQVALSIAFYFHYHDSHVAKDRSASPDVLVAGLIGAVLLLGGVLFRRRALLGFAALLVGLESLSLVGSIVAVLYLFFGGWLIFRVQKEQAKTKAAARLARKAERQPGTPAKPSGPPAATKRYTPPRRAASRGTTARRR